MKYFNVVEFLGLKNDDQLLFVPPNIIKQLRLTDLYLLTSKYKSVFGIFPIKLLYGFTPW